MLEAVDDSDSMLSVSDNVDRGPTLLGDLIQGLPLGLVGVEKVEDLAARYSDVK